LLVELVGVAHGQRQHVQGLELRGVGFGDVA
jgi:hypothetical protein